MDRNFCAQTGRPNLVTTNTPPPPARRPLGPQSVPTDSLRANPHNPRMLFDELPLRTLEESIKKVGILVPLTVYMAAGSTQYTILDGQRRWICAQHIGLPDVPVNEVAEPNTAQNIVTMFQIHKLRKDWELMPTALKLGVLMHELRERSDGRLANLTGLDIAVVTRCKKLLWYPRRYQELMLFPDPKSRVKADFFIELYPILTDRMVVKMKWYNRDEIIDRFLYKYQNRLSGIKSITDFRKIKQHLTLARTADRIADITTRLHRLVFDDDVDISILEIETAIVHKQAATLTKAVSRMREELRTITASLFLGEEELWQELEQLAAMIRRKLAEADRRPNL